MLDLFIQGATVYDGTLEPPKKLDIGIENGKILVSPLDTQAKKTIDAKGLCLTPGFIDMHSHGDMTLGAEYAKLSKISQGITTEMVGHCGSSMYPVDPNALELYYTLMSVGTKFYSEDTPNWNSFARYLEHVERTPRATNMKFLIGHGAVRLAVMGYENRIPTEAEMEEMKKYVREAMEHGAYGLSTGLVYTPSSFATMEEIIELAKIVGEYGGIYATHMRNESYDSLKSITEAIEIARQSNTMLNISHHKIFGQKNWGLSTETLKLIQSAIDEGMKVTIDQYPYDASYTHLNVCIPPWHFTDGIPALAKRLKEDSEFRALVQREMEDENSPFDNLLLNSGGYSGIFLSSFPVTTEAEGYYLTEYAEKIGMTPYDAFCYLMIENDGVGTAIYHSIGEEDMFRIIQNPNTVVGTDGNCRAFQEKGHPRSFGTFPRAIRYYHKEKQLFSLEEIIHKITMLTAERLQLKTKGRIADGMDADLVLFNYDTLNDNPTYSESNQLCDGIEYVIVNGEISYQDKKLTGVNAGQILLHTNEGN